MTWFTIANEFSDGNNKRKSIFRTFKFQEFQEWMKVHKKIAFCLYSDIERNICWDTAHGITGIIGITGISKHSKRTLYGSSVCHGISRRLNERSWDSAFRPKIKNWLISQLPTSYFVVALFRWFIWFWQWYSYSLQHRVAKKNTIHKSSLSQLHVTSLKVICR